MLQNAGFCHYGLNLREFLQSCRFNVLAAGCRLHSLTDGGYIDGYGNDGYGLEPES
jgi:hypothetical protein